MFAINDAWAVILYSFSLIIWVAALIYAIRNLIDVFKGDK